jgi:hypothetical protein
LAFPTTLTLIGAISMTIYYLMVKTHNITGLKYLCQTKKSNPHKYLGSGKYWKLHLLKHGKDIHTQILKECSNKDELKDWGIYYSNLWNVVDSEDWANLRPESGDGGPNFGALNGMFGKTHSDKAIATIKEKNTGIKLGTLAERYGNDRAMQMTEDRRKSMRQARASNKEWGDRLIKLASTPDAIAKRSGSKHTRYDHTIYRWTNKTTTEAIICTRGEFIKHTGQYSSAISLLLSGKIKQSKDWTVVKI